MAPDDDIWDTNPGDTAVDRASLAGRLKTCSALERVWILALGRCNEAVEEGQRCWRAKRSPAGPLREMANSCPPLRRR